MNYKDVIKLLEKRGIWYTFSNDVIVFSIETKGAEYGYNFNINDKNIDVEDLIEEIKSAKIIVSYKYLEIGDVINYDIPLRTKGKLKNETALILDKNNNVLKLSVLQNVWYCSFDMFHQLKNVSIVESD